MSAQALSQETYLQGLQRKIFEILAGIIDPKHIEIMFGQEAMSTYWLPAFTHESVDPENNYQTLEFYGDKAMNYAFTEYVRNLTKNTNIKINQHTGTLLTNKYVSKEHQAKMARDLGLVEHIRFDPEAPDYPKTNIDIQEDILESFFGALASIANDLITPGMGYIYVFNFLTELFNNVDIDFEDIQRDYITQLKELFEGIGWGLPDYKVKNSPYPEKGEKMAEVRGNTGDVIGIGYGAQDPAKFEAAKNALENLAKQGIDEEYMEKYKLEKKRKNVNFERQEQRVQAAIEKLNEISSQRGKVQIVNFKIAKVESHQTESGRRTTYAIQVAYKNPDDTLTWKTIDSSTGNDPTKTQIDLMTNFANKYHIPN